MAQQVDLAYEPVYLQGAADPGYDALDIRRASVGRGVGKEGAYDLTHFKVTQNTGANRFVNIAEGEAFVQGDSVVGQGMYYARQDGALNGSVDVTAADASFARLDQIVLEIKDDLHDGSGLNKARIRVVTGTPTSGADLNNRNGAAALPSTCLRLADVLVPAGGNVTNANIRDRRNWARGAYCVVTQTAGADLSTSSSTYSILDSANFKKRLETTHPCRMAVRGLGNISQVGDVGILKPEINSNQVDGTTGVEFHKTARGAGELWDVDLEWSAVPAAGSTQFGWGWFRVGTGAFTLERGTDRPCQVVYEEILKQNGSND